MAAMDTLGRRKGVSFRRVAFRRHGCGHDLVRLSALCDDLEPDERSHPSLGPDTGPERGDGGVDEPDGDHRPWTDPRALSQRVREDPPLCRLDRSGAVLGADRVDHSGHWWRSVAQPGLLDAVPDHPVDPVSLADTEAGEGRDREAVKPRGDCAVRLWRYAFPRQFQRDQPQSVWRVPFLRQYPLARPQRLSSGDQPRGGLDRAVH